MFIQIIIRLIVVAVLIWGAYLLSTTLFDLALLSHQRKQIAKTLEQLDRYADHTDRRLADLEKRIDRQKQLNKEILEETEAVLNDLIAENKKYDQSGENTHE